MDQHWYHVAGGLGHSGGHTSCQHLLAEPGQLGLVDHRHHVAGVEPDRSQCQPVVGLCLWIVQGDNVSGKQVFEQLVAFADGQDRAPAPITAEDYELWRKDFIWEALHGQRYGQSFCNRFGITDNHLYYAPGDIAWCDRYIRERYLA
jgi:hypothetical protein